MCTAAPRSGGASREPPLTLIGAAGSSPWCHKASRHWGQNAQVSVRPLSARDQKAHRTRGKIKVGSPLAHRDAGMAPPDRQPADPGRAIRAPPTGLAGGAEPCAGRRPPAARREMPTPCSAVLSRVRSVVAGAAHRPSAWGTPAVAGRARTTACAGRAQTGNARTRYPQSCGARVELVMGRSPLALVGRSDHFTVT